MFGWKAMLCFAVALSLSQAFPALADPAPDAIPNAVASPSIAESSHARPMGLYLHVGGGAGLGFMSSKALTDLFGDDFGIGLGAHFSYSAAAGFRNMLQWEVRRGDSSHTLRNNNIVTHQSVEIPMDYDFTEYVGKVNLLLPSKRNWERRETALFVVFGTSKIEYLDKAHDGFKGTGSVLGLEFTRFAPGGRGSVTIGFRRYGIEFDRITLLGHTGRFAVDASNYVLHSAISFGFGI